MSAEIFCKFASIGNCPWETLVHFIPNFFMLCSKAKPAGVRKKATVFTIIVSIPRIYKAKLFKENF